MQTRKEKDNETGKKKQKVIFGEADQKKEQHSQIYYFERKEKTVDKFHNEQEERKIEIEKEGMGYLEEKSTTSNKQERPVPRVKTQSRKIGQYYLIILLYYRKYHSSL